jgi:Domain of unknown function (DUF1772)
MASNVASALEIICIGLFAGGAMMELLVEHPARVSADSATAIDQMQSVLKRADPFMPALAIGGLIAGVAAWYLDGNLFEMIGGILMGLNIVLTLIAILPVNKKLLAYDSRVSPSDLKLEMRRWGYLHAVRTFAALTAFLLIAFGASFLALFHSTSTVP